MAETQHLILEHLRGIRGELVLAREDLQEVRGRLGHLEAQSAGLYGLFATTSTRLDRVEQRLARIDRRLELAP